MHWIHQQHPNYSAIRERLDFAISHYEGDVFEAVTARRDGTVQGVGASSLKTTGIKKSPFLHRHAQGESDYAYAERRVVTDYTPHYAFIMDSLAGQLFAKEGEASRQWTREDAAGVLGDPDDDGSIMARLWDDADGNGTNWETLWMSLVPSLITANVWGVYVDAGDETTGARVCLVDPRDVIDWHVAGGSLQWVKIRETAEASRLPDEEPDEITSYLVITQGGWSRYETSGEGETMDAALVAEAEHDYRAPDGSPMLPFFWARIPIRREVGYVVAKKANAVMNLESSRDWRLWTANVNRLHITTDQDPNDVRDAMRAGDSLIITSGDGAAAQYINPSQEPALAASEVLKQKIEALYHVAFRSYSDAARQVTATEIAADVASGVEAFLVLVAKALDEAENTALSLLEQVYAPGNADRVARVTRSRSFQPVLPDAKAMSLRDRYFPDAAIPVGESAMRMAAEKIADLDGLRPDPDELTEAVAEHIGTPADGANILTPRQRARVGAGIEPLDALSNLA